MILGEFVQAQPFLTPPMVPSSNTYAHPANNRRSLQSRNIAKIQQNNVIFLLDNCSLCDVIKSGQLSKGSAPDLCASRATVSLFSGCFPSNSSCCWNKNLTWQWAFKKTRGSTVLTQTTCSHWLLLGKSTMQEHTCMGTYITEQCTNTLNYIHSKHVNACSKHTHMYTHTHAHTHCLATTVTYETCTPSKHIHMVHSTETHSRQGDCHPAQQLKLGKGGLTVADDHSKEWLCVLSFYTLNS